MLYRVTLGRGSHTFVGAFAMQKDAHFSCPEACAKRNSITLCVIDNTTHILLARNSLCVFSHNVTSLPEDVRSRRARRPLRSLGSTRSGRLPTHTSHNVAIVRIQSQFTGSGRSLLLAVFGEPRDCCRPAPDCLLCRSASSLRGLQFRCQKLINQAIHYFTIRSASCCIFSRAQISPDLGKPASSEQAAPRQCA